MARFDNRLAALGRAQRGPVPNRAPAKQGGSGRAPDGQESPGVHRTPGFPAPSGLVRGSYIAGAGNEPDTAPGDGAAAGGAEPTATASPRRGRGGGRPSIGKAVNVRLTVEQRGRVDRMAALHGCGVAEAIRRAIDATPVPAPVERIAVDPAQYDALLGALNGIRIELNKAGGNLYRLSRDAYNNGAPTPSELAAIRADLDAGLDRLAAVATSVSGVSPWPT